MISACYVVYLFCNLVSLGGGTFSGDEVSASPVDFAKTGVFDSLDNFVVGTGEVRGLDGGCCGSKLVVFSFKCLHVRSMEICYYTAYSVSVHCLNFNILWVSTCFLKYHYHVSCWLQIRSRDMIPGILQFGIINTDEIK